MSAFSFISIYFPQNAGRLTINCYINAKIGVIFILSFGLVSNIERDCNSDSVRNDFNLVDRIILIVRSTEKNYQIKILICQFMSMHEYDLSVHANEIHAKKIRTFQCPHCNKGAKVNYVQNSSVNALLKMFRRLKRKFE